jgi:hypothetical protein
MFFLNNKQIPSNVIERAAKENNLSVEDYVNTYNIIDTNNNQEDVLEEQTEDTLEQQTQDPPEEQTEDEKIKILTERLKTAFPFLKEGSQSDYIDSIQFTPASVDLYNNLVKQINTLKKEKAEKTTLKLPKDIRLTAKPLDFSVGAPVVKIGRTNINEQGEIIQYLQPIMEGKTQIGIGVGPVNLDEVFVSAESFKKAENAIEDLGYADFMASYEARQQMIGKIPAAALEAGLTLRQGATSAIYRLAVKRRNPLDDIVIGISEAIENIQPNYDVSEVLFGNKEIPAQTMGSSVLNSIVNGLNTLTGFDERAYYLLLQILANSGGLEIPGVKENLTEELRNVDKRLNNLNEARLKTIQFSDIALFGGDRANLIEKPFEAIGGSLAAGFDAMTQFGASLAIAAGTGGYGLATDMVSYAIKDYNDTKSRELGYTNAVDFVKDGHGEVLLPATLGLFGYSFERIGIKGFNKWLQSQPTSNLNAVFGLFTVGTKEGWTEWSQLGVETLNINLAKGLSLRESSEAAFDKMFSPEGLNVFVTGLVGGPSLGGASMLLKKTTSIIKTPQEEKYIKKKINELIKLENKKNKKSTSLQDLGYINTQQQEIIYNLRNIYNKNLDLVGVMSNNQIDRINFASEVITNNNNEINQINADESLSNDTKQNEINTLLNDNKIAQEIIKQERLAAEKIFTGIENIKKVSKQVSGVTIINLKDNDEVLRFINAGNFSEKTKQSVSKKVNRSQAFVIQDNISNQQAVVINEANSLNQKAVGVGQHEFVHVVWYNALKNMPQAYINLGNDLLNELDRINPQAVENSKFKKRLELYNNSSREVKMEEAMSLYAEALVTGDLKPTQNIIKQIKNNVQKALGRNNVNIVFNEGKDVVEFIENIVKSIDKGVLTDAQIKVIEGTAEGKLISNKQEGKVNNKNFIIREALKESTEDTQVKLSKSLNEQVDDLVGEKDPDGKYKVTKKEWDAGAVANSYIAIIEGDLLDNSIKKGINRGNLFGKNIETFVEDVKKGLTGTLLRFNPEINNSLIGWINNQLSKRKNDVLLSYKRQTPTGVQAVSLDVATDTGSFVQIPDTTPLFDEVIDSQTQTATPVSTLRRRIVAHNDRKFTDNAPKYNEFKNLVFGRAREVLKELQEENIKPGDKNYRNMLLQKAGIKLDAFVNDEIFGGRDQALFKKFLNKNVNLFNELSIQYLRNADVGNLRKNKGRIFTGEPTRLTTQDQIRKAVRKNIAFVENETQGVLLFPRKKPTQQQILDFFQGEDIPPTLRSNRKAQLREELSTILIRDAIPQVQRETGELIQDAPIIGRKIERDPRLKFSLDKSLPTGGKLPKNANIQDVLNKMKQLNNEYEQQIKPKKQVDLNKDFNDILENKTGIASEKIYSKVAAEVAGSNKGKFNFFIPSTAEDFVGLLYRTLGKGKLGDQQMAWYKTHLLNPFARAQENITRERARLYEDYVAVKDALNIISQKTLFRKKEGVNLKSKIGSRYTTIKDFTKETAVRVYIWNKQNEAIPGISIAEEKNLVQYVESDKDLKAFAEMLKVINKGDKYVKPQQNWIHGTIATDLELALNTIKRAKYLEPWKKNVDIIFSQDNLNKLQAAFGKTYVSSLKNILQRMEKGTNRLEYQSQHVTDILNFLNGSIGNIMFLNSRSALLQTISAANFLNWSDNNVFAAGKAFSNQKQYWKDFMYLINSDYLAQRRGGLRINVSESEIADLASRKGPRAKIAWLLNKGFVLTRYADSFAIGFGGSTFYRNRLNTYLNKKDAAGNNLYTEKGAANLAFKDFKEIAEESQQSSRPDKISMQQAQVFGRLVLAFANAPMQYMRLSKKAALDLVNRRGDWRANVSKMIYYAAVQNIIFSSIQNAIFANLFQDDDDEELEPLFTSREYRIVNNSIDAVLRGIGVRGAVTAGVKNAILRGVQEIEKSKAGKRGAPSKVANELTRISPPISYKVGRAIDVASAFYYERQAMKDDGFSINNPALLAGANTVSFATNIPADRVVRKLQNVNTALYQELEMWQRFALIGGWSAWELGIEEDNTRMGPGRTPTRSRSASAGRTPTKKRSN